LSGTSHAKGSAGATQVGWSEQMVVTRPRQQTWGIVHVTFPQLIIGFTPVPVVDVTEVEPFVALVLGPVEVWPVV